MRSDAKCLCDCQGRRGGATAKMPFDVRQKAYLAKIYGFRQRKRLPRREKSMKCSIDAGLPRVTIGGYHKKKNRRGLPRSSIGVTHKKVTLGERK